MLAPHHGKDAELGVARRAAEDFHGVGVFFRREVVFGNQLWGDGGFGHGKYFNSIKLCNAHVIFDSGWCPLLFAAHVCLHQ